MTSTKKRLSAYFKAGYAGIFLKSYEEQRVEAELLAVAAEIDFKLYVWTVTGSLVGPIGQEPPTIWNGDDGAPLDPIGLLQKMNKVLPEKAIVLAKDYHLFTNEANPFLVRHMKDCLSEARNNLRRLVILGCQFKLVTELEKEFTMVEFELPDRDELKGVLQGIADSAKVHMNGNTDKILDAACGMTTTEAADAFALSVIESGGTDIPPEVVAREKSNVVRKNGLLEIIDQHDSIADVGGNQAVKDWIIKRKNSFTKEAKEFGLPVPRGLLLVGIPGCGKTQFGRVIASVLNVPLIKLDAGKIFAGLVGQSESNLRSVIQTVEAVSPCVLLVDEIEKGLSGSKSSGQTDGGTSARVFGTFLQWMNDKTSPVFVVATANDISQLPPEFLRKGRFDELFFSDLPDEFEREEIFRIHIAKRKRNPDGFALGDLARISEGFTGAEIEAVVVEAMFIAFDRNQDLSNENITEAVSGTVPLSKTMASQVDAIRTWAKGRARRASDVKAVSKKQARKLA